MALALSFVGFSELRTYMVKANTKKGLRMLWDSQNISQVAITRNEIESRCHRVIGETMRRSAAIWRPKLSSHSPPTTQIIIIEAVVKTSYAQAGTTAE
jgi:hypothetical protein